MTTLRDILNDFAQEIKDNEKMVTLEDKQDTEDIIENYIKQIKERIVG